MNLLIQTPNASSLPFHIRPHHRHSGAVWQVCWAHPKFGNIIASCSYDKRVMIWKEEQNRQWAVVWDSAQFNVHDSSGMARSLFYNV